MSTLIEKARRLVEREDGAGELEAWSEEVAAALLCAVELLRRWQDFSNVTDAPSEEPPAEETRDYLRDVGAGE